MSVEESAFWIEVFGALLFIAVMWRGVIRKVILDAVKRSHYESRDKLRKWYSKLPRAKKEEQKFSFMFMERSINTVVANAEKIQIWDFLLFARNFNHDDMNQTVVKRQVQKFFSEADPELRRIDDQHTTIFGLLFIVNSPIAFAIIVTCFVGHLFLELFSFSDSGPSQMVERRVSDLRNVSHSEATA